ncbi:MAG TPA: tRNA pseudouridine(55) synthase TruB [Wenzhouxiangella sp.]|nr:tRNA pseudouridine(55) synthase TruB [Wenzhouxiangella sp.]
MNTDGILLLDKPLGLSSNQALGRARRALGIRKAGHAGTLDPMASGLLVLCFGQATKVAGYLLEADKRYEATVRLGVSTDSGDAEGAVLESRPVPDFSADEIEAVLDKFRGAIEQTPPMYSALKHKGKRLYELARQGKTVERKPRAVTIHALTLTDFSEKELQLTVHCSKGTYVRSLAMDIGRALGCGAHLTALRRTASQPFELAAAVSLDGLEGLSEDAARRLLIAPDRALSHFPKITLGDIQARQISQGQRLNGIEARHSGLVRIYGAHRFLGIGEADGRGRLKPVRLFVSD